MMATRLAWLTLAIVIPAACAADPGEHVGPPPANAPSPSRDEEASVRLEPIGTCAADHTGVVPSTLDEALAELDRMVAPRDRELFKRADSVDWHSGVGMTLRNCWGLWQAGSLLGAWFHPRGVDHPDDISGIVLESFRRELLGKPLDVDGQIARAGAYWRDWRVSRGSNCTPIFEEPSGWMVAQIKGVSDADSRRLVSELAAQAGDKLRACWSRMPLTTNDGLDDTAVVLILDAAGQVTASRLDERVTKTVDARCMADALAGVSLSAAGKDSVVVFLDLCRHLP